MKPDGSLQLKQTRSAKVSIPANMAQSWERNKMMATCWESVKLELPNWPALSVLSPYTWTEHLDWRLGEKVRGREIRTSSGTHTFSATWPTLLEYEYQLRKHAYYLVNTTGITLPAALAKARANRGGAGGLLHHTHVAFCRS